MQVKAALVLEREQGSGRLARRDGFGGLSAGATIAHRELGILSALPCTSLRILVPIDIPRNRGPLPPEG